MTRFFGQALKFGSLGLVWLVNATLEPVQEEAQVPSTDDN